jgi:hypothetical protein
MAWGRADQSPQVIGYSVRRRSNVHQAMRADVFGLGRNFAGNMCECNSGFVGTGADIVAELSVSYEIRKCPKCLTSHDQRSICTPGLQSKRQAEMRKKPMK